MKTIEQDESSKFFENKIACDYVSTRVAAQFLGISENALRIKVCRGFVPCYHIGRSLRFKISELSKLFQRKE